MQDQSFEYRRLWIELYEEEGLEAVRKDVASESCDYRDVGEKLIRELEEKERIDRQEAREERALEQGEKSYHQVWISIAIAGLAVLVGIAIAFIDL